MNKMNRTRPDGSNRADTLFRLFRAETPVPVFTGVVLLFLLRLKKSVIPYRIGPEPSISVACSQYTLFEKTYRQYVLNRIAPRANYGGAAISFLLLGL